MTDAVNHPEHYGGENNPYEVIKVLKAWMTPEQYMGFLIGNVFKYLARAEHKSPANPVEDVKKASFYLQEAMRSYRVQC